MMRARPVLWLLVLCSFIPSRSAAADPAPPGPLVTGVLAEFDRIAGQPFWPNFDPRKIPFALWDGERTWLVRHPGRPEGFVPAGDLQVYPGRHPEMRANTAIDFAGALTATLLLDPSSSRGPRDWAEVLLHETFHVFQRQRHPKWSANEAELFLYPVDDAGLLALRRLETEALRRAVAASEPGTSACWARRAVDLRRERFAGLPAGSAAYERGSELNEGLAAFVESLAAGGTKMPELPANDFPATQVRQRFYATGPALAVLLDRFDPQWRVALEEGKAESLDGRLAQVLADRSTEGCGFGTEETARIRENARREAGEVAAGRQALRASVLGRGGASLVLETAGEPLWPQGFDPLNVETLGAGEILHKRFLKLGNGSGSLEVLDRDALTLGAGDHPLFNGVRRLTLTGLAAAPTVQREGETVHIQAQGFQAELRGATVETEGQVLKIRLPGSGAAAAPRTEPAPPTSKD